MCDAVRHTLLAALFEFDDVLVDFPVDLRLYYVHHSQDTLAALRNQLA
jgi:hypothetical protein